MLLRLLACGWLVGAAALADAALAGFESGLKSILSWRGRFLESPFVARAEWCAAPPESQRGCTLAINWQEGGEWISVCTDIGDTERPKIVARYWQLKMDCRQLLPFREGPPIELIQEFYR